ncbi:hypothetical protein ODZ84_13850 [Chryseobacterium fluminis]|uniref:hypothetical protein n=1 Tax=Chryseobacterium fluminis TaxID=2983606 RepID=UPI002254E8EE|nr:hypothetical protein [Chryseobacterium sp. MMS21-Ot14]UZT96309.1 hypothetical protein ODZ84_13850 [Chryseobacterium sp. MMS21-Ot14]
MNLDLTWTSFDDNQQKVIKEYCALLLDQGFNNSETNFFTLYNQDSSYIIINILKDHIFVNKQRWINSKYNFIEPQLNAAKTGARFKEIIDNLILAKEADEDKNLAYFETVKNMITKLKEEHEFADLYDFDCQTNRMRKLIKHEGYNKSTFIFNFNKLNMIFIFEGNSEHKSSYLPIESLLSNTVEENIEILMSFNGMDNFIGVNGFF